MVRARMIAMPLLVRRIERIMCILMLVAIVEAVFMAVFVELVQLPVQAPMLPAFAKVSDVPAIEERLGLAPLREPKRGH